MPPTNQSTLGDNLYVGEFSKQIKSECININPEELQLKCFIIFCGKVRGSKLTQNILYELGQ